MDSTNVQGETWREQTEAIRATMESDAFRERYNLDPELTDTVLKQMTALARKQYIEPETMDLEADVNRQADLVYNDYLATTRERLHTNLMNNYLGKVLPDMTYDGEGGLGKKIGETIQNSLAAEEGALEVYNYADKNQNREFIISTRARENIETLVSTVKKGNDPNDAQYQQRRPLYPDYQISEENQHLNLKQRDAIRTILEGKQQFVMVIGRAGAGKTSAMVEVRNAIQKKAEETGETLKLFATSPTSAQSARLKEDGFDMPVPRGFKTDNNERSVNLSMMLTWLEAKPGAETDAREGLTGQAARGVSKGLNHNDLENYKNKLRDSTLIIDEAWMRGDVESVLKLVNHARELNMKLVFVGDPEQTTFQQGTKRDNAFTILRETGALPTKYIDEIVRQKDDEIKGDLYRRIAGALANSDLDKAWAMMEENPFSWDEIDPDDKRNPLKYETRKNNGLEFRFSEDTGPFRTDQTYRLHHVEKDSHGIPEQVFLQDAQGQIVQDAMGPVALPLHQPERFAVTESGYNMFRDIEAQDARLDYVVEKYMKGTRSIYAFYNEDRTAIMEKLRVKLKEENKIYGDEHSFDRFVNTHAADTGGQWQKSDNTRIDAFRPAKDDQKGHIIVLNQRFNKYMEKGTRWEVIGKNTHTLTLRNADTGAEQYYDPQAGDNRNYTLPLSWVSDLQNKSHAPIAVFDRERFDLAAGDEIYVTKNKTFDRKVQRIDGTVEVKREAYQNNPENVYRVTRFEYDEDNATREKPDWIVVTNSQDKERWRPADFGHLDYAAVKTWVKAQGETVDVGMLYVGDAIKSSPASYDGLYVAVTRAKENFEIVSPGRTYVRDAVEKTTRDIATAAIVAEGEKVAVEKTERRKSLETLKDELSAKTTRQLEQYIKNQEHTIKNYQKMKEEIIQQQRAHHHTGTRFVPLPDRSTIPIAEDTGTVIHLTRGKVNEKIQDARDRINLAEEVLLQRQLDQAANDANKRRRGAEQEEDISKGAP